MKRYIKAIEVDVDDKVQNPWTGEWSPVTHVRRYGRFLVFETRCWDIWMDIDEVVDIIPFNHERFTLMVGEQS